MKLIEVADTLKISNNGIGYNVHKDSVVTVLCSSQLRKLTLSQCILECGLSGCLIFVVLKSQKNVGWKKLNEKISEIGAYFEV